MSPYAARRYAAVGTEGRVTGADPHGLILLLFDGALERIELARAALAAGDVGRKAGAIAGAQRIVEGLLQSLDPAAGGELAQRLSELYQLVSRRLLHANVHDDAGALGDARRVLSELRAGWAGIAGRT